MSRFTFLISIAFLLLPTVSCTGKNEVPAADIVVWHWMTDRQAVFDKLSSEYLEQTGTKVLFETYAPSEVYKDKVRAAASGKLLPEIFSPLGDKRETAAFVNAGYIADLTSEMDKGWKQQFFDRPLAQFTYTEGNSWNVKPGIYGIPIDVSAIMIYYNKDLFKTAGLDPDNPPATWDDFIAAGKKLRSAGIQPFVSGFGEEWLIGVFADSYKWNLLGRQGILDTIAGKISYTDPRWIRVFSLFEEMRNAGMFAAGVATMVNKDAERVFATGKAAMAFNGSWAVNVYHTMNKDMNYGIMMPPKLADARFPMLISGGEGSSFFINATAYNKDKAVAFMKWFTGKEQQAALARETRNIPSNREAARDIPDILRKFAGHIDETFEPLPVMEQWQVANTLNANLQSMIIGEKTADQAAGEVQAEKQRAMSAK